MTLHLPSNSPPAVDRGPNLDAGPSIPPPAQKLDLLPLIALVLIVAIALVLQELFLGTAVDKPGLVALKPDQEAVQQPQIVVLPKGRKLKHLSFKLRSFSLFEGVMIDACAATGGPSVNPQYNNKDKGR